MHTTVRKIKLVCFILFSCSLTVSAPIWNALSIIEPIPVEPYKRLAFAVGMVETKGIPWHIIPRKEQRATFRYVLYDLLIITDERAVIIAGKTCLITKPRKRYFYTLPTRSDHITWNRLPKNGMAQVNWHLLTGTELKGYSSIGHFTCKELKLLLFYFATIFIFIVQVACQYNKHFSGWKRVIKQILMM